MKRCHGFWPLVLMLSLAATTSARADRGPRADRLTAETAPSDLGARARQLADEVRELAGSPAISRTKKEKRISAAVRVAVVAATADHNGQAESLSAAIALAAAAARAAPAFAEVIAKAATFAPTVAQVDGAAGRIRSAAFAAARDHRSLAAGPAAAPTPVDETPARAASGAAMNAEPDAPSPDLTRTAAVDPSGDTQVVDESARNRGPRVLAREDRGFKLTLAFGVRYDDNFYLDHANEVGETIASVTPGVEFDWGQHSLVRGTVAYQEAFSRFTGGTDSNIALGSGGVNLGFDDGNVKAALGATYQQLYQSNTDVLTSGPSTLIQTDLFGANGSIEAPVGSKLSVSVGSAMSDTQYRNDGLIGNRRLDFPLNVYFKVTPKADLSAGYTQGVQRPTGAGASSRDRYFNLGARGEFTAKLTGTFTFGYQTRQVAANPTERMFAFDGTLDYEVTPKTGATLTFNRNFNASALGASTKNTALRLGLNTDISPQWQVGANLGYLENEYGADVFLPGSAPASSGRIDHIWEGRLSASYLYSAWLSTSASYTAQRNRSTLTDADFVDNLLSLSVGLRY